MSADLKTQVDELLARSEALELGDDKVMLAEEAVRLADLHGDAVLGFRARNCLIEAANFSGLEEREFAPFSWNLAQCDRDPSRFPADRLLWYYKWIMGDAVGRPQFSLETVDAMFRDMEARYRAAGCSLRPVYKLRRSLAVIKGDESEARDLYQRWQSAPRDHYADCRACDRSEEVEHWTFLGEDERAILRATPILEGKMRCTVVPRTTLTIILLPLMRLGRVAEAMKFHQRGYRLSIRNLRWIDDAAYHMVFLALTDHLTRAIHLLESHQPFPISPLTADSLGQFRYFLAARLVLERLAAAGRKTVKLRLSASFPEHRAEGRYEVAALESWFRSGAGRIAARFDARHQSDGFAREVAANLELGRLATPFPLT